MTASYIPPPVTAPDTMSTEQNDESPPASATIAASRAALAVAISCTRGGGVKVGATHGLEAQLAPQRQALAKLMQCTQQKQPEGKPKNCCRVSSANSPEMPPQRS